MDSELRRVVSYYGVDRERVMVEEGRLIADGLTPSDASAAIRQRLRETGIPEPLTPPRCVMCQGAYDAPRAACRAEVHPGNAAAEPWVPTHRVKAVGGRLSISARRCDNPHNLTPCACGEIPRPVAVRWAYPGFPNGHNDWVWAVECSCGESDHGGWRAVADAVDRWNDGSRSTRTNIDARRYDIPPHVTLGCAELPEPWRHREPEKHECSEIPCECGYWESACDCGSGVLHSKGDHSSCKYLRQSIADESGKVPPVVKPIDIVINLDSSREAPDPYKTPPWIHVEGTVRGIDRGTCPRCKGEDGRCYCLAA